MACAVTDTCQADRHVKATGWMRETQLKEVAPEGHRERPMTVVEQLVDQP